MQQNETPLIRALTLHYDKVGILSTKFRCKRLPECQGCRPPALEHIIVTPENFEQARRQLVGKFVQAKSAFVGEGYENARELGIPRLMFVTSDPGSSLYADDGRNWIPRENRTPEAVRRFRSGSKAKLDRRGVGHRTNQVARGVFLECNPGSDIGFASLESEELTTYVANVNSAKCCQNKPGYEEADDRLFKNCRMHLRGEIDALAPDVVVTMGKWAKQGVEAAFEIQSQWGCERELALGGGKRALWIPIIQRHSREERKKIAERVREFISTARNDIMPR